MLDDPGACNPPEIPPEVEALRAHRLREGAQPGGGKPVDLQRLVVPFLGQAEDAPRLVVCALDVLEPPGSPELLQSQRLQRKTASRLAPNTTMTPRRTQKASRVPSPG